MEDLFTFAENNNTANESYTAKDIEVLEGLEPVRRRPGMYIGGTDESSLHHLVSEVIDNSMDEAVAGYANRIEIEMHLDGSLTIRDNGRGIPIDPHPKFPDKSALEIILTTLHSGGKFSNKAYQTAGGLHGVGISVVNALSSFLAVEVVRDKVLYRQEFSRGAPTSALTEVKKINNRRGTAITFLPDPEIFGKNAALRPKLIYQLAKSKAYLFRGVEIKWQAPKELLINAPDIPEQDKIHFPGGLKDYISSKMKINEQIIPEIFSGEIIADDKTTKIEWAVGWNNNCFMQSYCNTIPTPLGGTHEQGFRSALLKALKVYGELTNNKKLQSIIIDDILSSACIALSVFIKEPVFQGQTKEKLVSAGVNKIIENAIKNYFDHWLSGNKNAAEALINHFVFVIEERLNRKNEKNINRKTATQRLRLPGKLADCSRDIAKGTEIFIVEGDAAGGSAKMARNRETQAILPIKGKILNVANSTEAKISLNQQAADIEIALACGTLKNYNNDNLRYEKVILMTDADVDGAHIASLLMTFFFMRMPQLINNGHLYLAKPPLFRITQGANSFYAASDQEKDSIVAKLSKKNKTKIDIGRFKGLGEMNAKQLKETTMDPNTRSLIKVNIADFDKTGKIVDDLMGKKPEKRFNFIQEQALSKMDIIKDNLDI